MWKALLALLGRSKMRRETLLARTSNGAGSIVPVEDWIEMTAQVVAAPTGGLLPLPGTWTLEATCDAPDDPNAKWTTLRTGSGTSFQQFDGTYGGFRASVAGMVNYEISIVLVGR